METETTEAVVDSTNNEGEGEATVEVESITIPKKDYDKMNQTVGSLKKEVKDLKKSNVPKEETPLTKPTGELDDTQLDYLDLKGITEEEDITVIKSVMSKTGQSLRQALKDDYVVAKLKDLRGIREVKNATPSSTKRTGEAINNIDIHEAKWKQTGELPTDFETRSRLVNKLVEEGSTNRPGWKR